MISIAIDGPSGAGKSTISRKAAEKFGFIYVDTGAIYRTIGFAAKKYNVNADDTAAVINLLPKLSIELKYADNGEQHMFLDGCDVSYDIRLPDVSMLASKVSAIPEVRAYLVEMQRNMARNHDVVMDGRDIGTVILPNADIKIFLTASVTDRAHRRYDELCSKGIAKSFDEVLEEMKQRDNQDMERTAAPLKAADDAIVVDTSGNSLEKSIDIVCRIISEKIERKAGKME